MKTHISPIKNILRGLLFVSMVFAAQNVFALEVSYEEGKQATVVEDSSHSQLIAENPPAEDTDSVPAVESTGDSDALFSEIDKTTEVEDQNFEVIIEVADIVLITKEEEYKGGVIQVKVLFTQDWKPESSFASFDIGLKVEGLDVLLQQKVLNYEEKSVIFDIFLPVGESEEYKFEAFVVSTFSLDLEHRSKEEEEIKIFAVTPALQTSVSKENFQEAAGLLLDYLESQKKYYKKTETSKDSVGDIVETGSSQNLIYLEDMVEKTTTKIEGGLYGFAENQFKDALAPIVDLQVGFWGKLVGFFQGIFGK